MAKSRSLLQRIREFASKSTANPGDPPRIQAAKQQFVMTMISGISSGLLFAFIYAALSEVLFAVILLIIALITLILVILLGMGKLRFRTVHRFYLGTNMIGNFLGTLALGGIANSTGVFLYILGSPFGMITRSTREFMRWFGMTIALVMLEAALQPLLRSQNNIPPEIGAILWGVNFLVVGAFLYGNLAALLKQRDTALEDLQAEKVKSENLLLNILPQKIADRLKEEQGTLAEAHEEVTILFADIVGFTPLTTQLPPAEMVGLLNQIYTHFDTLSEKYHVEKIRTIGDNYMAASGVPESKAKHAQDIAKMALEMQAYVNELPPQKGHKIQLRVGLNSGPVIAGIVGTRKFHYDIWSDAVNTASRMESHSLPGKIHVTQTTYNLLKDEFTFELRGELEIKGKGSMKTYFLTGTRHANA